MVITEEIREIRKLLKSTEIQIFMGAMELVNENIDSLKGTKLYRGKLKHHAKELQKEVDTSIDALFEGVGDNQHKISDQYIGLSTMIQRWMQLTILFTLNNPNGIIELNNQVLMLFQKHDRSPDSIIKNVINYLENEKS